MPVTKVVCQGPQTVGTTQQQLQHTHYIAPKVHCIQHITSIIVIRCLPLCLPQVFQPAGIWEGDPFRYLSCYCAVGIFPSRVPNSPFESPSCLQLMRNWHCISALSVALAAGEWFLRFSEDFICLTSLVFVTQWDNANGKGLLKKKMIWKTLIIKTNILCINIDNY